MYHISSESTCICCIMRMDVSNIQPFAHHQACVSSVVSWRTSSTSVRSSYKTERVTAFQKCERHVTLYSVILKKKIELILFWNKYWIGIIMLMGYLYRAGCYCGKRLRVAALWRFPVLVWAKSQTVLRVLLVVSQFFEAHSRQSA
jgi:hypothetical protein